MIKTNNDPKNTEREIIYLNEIEIHTEYMHV